MSGLRPLFVPLYAYVLLWEDAVCQGEAQPPFAQVRDGLVQLIERQETAAQRQGLDDAFREGLFAFVAWVDEIVLKQTAWQGHQAWNARPLQVDYFRMRNAGEEAFEKLATLSPEHDEVREVYFASLGLGFQGRYFIDPTPLHKIRHELARQLALPVTDTQSLDKLTPQPYEVRVEAPARPPIHHPPVQAQRTQAQTPPPQAQAPRPRIQAQRAQEPIPLRTQAQPPQNPRPRIQAQDQASRMYVLDVPERPSWLRRLGLALLVALPLCGLAYWFLLSSPPPPPPHHALRIDVRGPGMVISTPAGIQCGTQCEQRFEAGTEVALEALPDPQMKFSGWQGDPACAQGRLTLQGDTTCTAVFTPQPDIPQAIARLVAPYQAQCPAVTIDVTEEQDGVVILSGRLAHQEHRAELLAGVQNLEGVQQAVADTVWIMPQAACDVVALLQSFQDRDAQPYDSMVHWDTADEYPTFSNGDQLSVALTTPPFNSHVYVDYYVLDDYVGHLLPNEREPANTFEPGTSYVAGHPDGQTWRVSEPFGLELVTVIASRQQLFPPRDRVEAAPAYVSVLQRALEGLSTAGVVAEVHFIVTRDKP